MRVSIVMPVYDPPVELFDAAVRSVQAQTYSDWELVMVDDGSRRTDVRDALTRWERDDERITVHRQENGGPSRARNTGTRLATGDYVMYVDADDELTVHALESATTAAAETKADLVIGFLQGVEMEADKVMSTDMSHRLLSVQESASFYDYTLSGRGGALFRRTGRILVKNGPIVRLLRKTIAQQVPFAEDLVVSEDTIWNLRMLANVQSIALCSDIWYWYWVSHGSTSRGYRTNAPSETRAVLDALAESVPLMPRPIAKDLVLSRILGEVNRAVRTHYVYPESQLSERQKRKHIRELMRQPSVSAYVSLAVARSGGASTVLKYALCASGLVLYYWRWKQARAVADGKLRNLDD